MSQQVAGGILSSCWGQAFTVLAVDSHSIPLFLGLVFPRPHQRTCGCHPQRREVSCWMLQTPLLLTQTCSALAQSRATLPPSAGEAPSCRAPRWAWAGRLQLLGSSHHSTWCSSLTCYSSPPPAPSLGLYTLKKSNFVAILMGPVGGTEINHICLVNYFPTISLLLSSWRDANAADNKWSRTEIDLSSLWRMIMALCQGVAGAFILVRYVWPSGLKVKCRN
jgi:hypothetical protein